MKLPSVLPVVAIALVMPSGSRAQTQLDLRTQTKSVDFSTALSTRPFKTGTDLPAACMVGEAFFKTDATAGQNWFGCSSSNTWSQQSGSGSEGALNGYNVVTFTSAPVFTASGKNDTTFLLLLTGNVNGSSLSSASAGAFLTFRVCQDGAGGHSFVWPSNVQGAGRINQTANACTSQTFVFDGTTAQATSSATITGLSGSAITMPGSTSGETTLQPSAIAGGTLILPARTATIATTLGTSTANNCAKFDDAGNLVDAGGACGSGGSSNGGTGTMFDTTGAGSWWPFGVPQSAGPTSLLGTPAANRVVYREFVVPATLTFRSMRWWQVGHEAGKHYTWGVMDATKSLVTNGQCDTVPSTSNAALTCAMAGPVTLTPGTYYLAWSSDSTSTTMTFYGTQDSFLTAQILAGLASPRVFYGQALSTGTTTITLPPSFASDTLTTRAWEIMPHVVFVP